MHDSLKSLASVALCVACVACVQSVRLRPDAVKLTGKVKDKTTPAVWSLPLDAPYADLLEPIGDSEVLVGALAWNDKFGTFRRGVVMLIELESGHEKWRLDSTALPSGPTVLIQTEPEIVFATVTADATTITAVAHDNGSVMWSRRFGRRAGFGLAPVLARPSIIVADDGSVHAIETSTGIDRWATPIPAAQTPIAFSVWVGEPAVYAITDRVSRISLDGGQLEWTSAEIIDCPVTDTLRVNDQLVTIGAAAVVSINTIDGRVSWRHAREGLKPLAVTTLNQMLLVAWKRTTSSIASELTLHDPMDGTLSWHSEPLPEIRGGPLVDEDGTVLISTAALLMRVDARSGAILSRGKLPLEMIGKRGLPDRLTVHDRQVVLRREKGFVLIDLASMKTQWTLPILAAKQDEWATFEQAHYAWLSGMSTIPPTTIALLAQVRRAAADALAERARRGDEVTRLTADSTRAASDALHAYLAAQSQAYLDDDRALNLHALANMRSAQHDYFDGSSGFALVPVTYQQERNGVLVVDALNRSAAAVWAGPHIDGDVVLAMVDNKHGRLITVAPSFDIKQQKAYMVRGAIRHTSAVAAYQMDIIDASSPTDAVHASAEMVGYDAKLVEIPRFIAAHEGTELARRFPDHGCPKDYATMEFAGGTLAHYAVHADDADLLVGLVRNGASMEATGGGDYSVLELAQMVSKPETIELVKSPHPTKNDALRTAAAQGDTQDVLRLLGSDADPNTGLIIPGCDFGALHFAIVKHDTRMVDALLKAGAWVNFMTPEGTALDVANTYKAPKPLVQLIRAKGGKRSAESKKAEAAAQKDGN
jgi:hypothetical protein